MRPNPALYVIMAGVGAALLPHPYGYYQVMRWVVTASCAWLSINAHRSSDEGWVWCWAVVAGIYNPVLPIHASRAVWSVVNLATIAIAVWYGVKLKKQTKVVNDARRI